MWAQWSNRVGRAEENSLASYERAILAARDAVFARDASGHAAPEDVIGQLERLARLHESGALTDDEFNAQKAKLLGQ